MPLENPGRKSSPIQRILSNVEHEIERATAAYGPFTKRHEAYAVILEELDEFWDEVKRNPAKMKLGEELLWQEHMRKELIQVAAMAVRAIHDLHLGEV